MSDCILIDGKTQKIVKSPSYNFVFNKENGFFARWGKTKDEDPTYSPFGPEICDMEISSVCSGVDGVGVCKFCYKSNTPTGQNMSLDSFKKIFHKLPRTVTQIAFGIGNLPNHKHGGNPDMWDIFDYTRAHGVIPNVTINGEGADDETVSRLVSVCGAIAVSIYDKNKSYDAVKKLTDKGMKQVNIHQVIHDANFEFVKEVINDIKNDDRLAKLNAIVFLSLKPKGRGKNASMFKPLSQEKFEELISFVESFKINYGMDSCTAGKYVHAIDTHPNKKQLLNMVEGCESTRMSSYINVEGLFFPCSFMEGEVVENGGDWREGLDVLNCNNFVKDVWMNEKTKLFREKCIKCAVNNEGCLHYII